MEVKRIINIQKVESNISIFSLSYRHYFYFPTGSSIWVNDYSGSAPKSSTHVEIMFNKKSMISSKYLLSKFEKLLAAGRCLDGS